MARRSGHFSTYFPPADADLFAPGGGASKRGGTADHHCTRVAYFHEPEVGNFHFGVKHPMKPHRLTLTNHLVSCYGLMEKMEVYLPRRATEEELKAFHAEDYVDFLKRVTPDNQNKFASLHGKFNVGQEEDCPIFAGMYDFCSIYAGASIEAARKLTQDGTDIAVNWSGGLHHAKRSEASGFCYVNDIVLAIFELLRFYPRVLYIDIDVHHGDGVQEAFYSTDRVMTVSFHKYGGNFFPGTGDRVEIGNSRGKYYSLNIPLQDGIEDDQYVYLFREVMEQVILRYRPSAIVLQCGTDSLGLDRLGVFNLSIKAHGECVRFIKNFKIPLLVLGGGGYTIRNVARCWTYETAVVLDTKLDARLPDNVYYDYFGPDHSLHPDLHNSGRDNQNTRESIEQLRVAALEHLRYLDGAPSVMMQEIPPAIDGLSSTASRSEEQRDDEAPDWRCVPTERRAHPAEYYDGESDGDMEVD